MTEFDLDKMVLCVRCNGTSHVPRENLHEGELQRRLPESGITAGIPSTSDLIFEYDSDEHACPTCTPFGPFGMVPLGAAVEGALIGKKPKTKKQIQRENWLHWMMNR